MILEATKSKELKAIFVITVQTAMRQSEIASLKWVNIDFNNRTAHLPETQPGGSRDVPLSSLAIEMNKSIPKRMIQEENKNHILILMLMLLAYIQIVFHMHILELVIELGKPIFSYVQNTKLNRALLYW